MYILYEQVHTEVVRRCAGVVTINDVWQLLEQQEQLTMTTPYIMSVSEKKNGRKVEEKK